MTLSKIFAACILVCYSSFCFSKAPMMHTRALNKKISRSHKLKKGLIHKKESKSVNSAETTVSNDDSGAQKDDDSFFSHLSKLDIPEKYRLKEIIIGSDVAPKNLIIYFSYTCPHCREFHIKEFPKFKKEYVDTKKIKVIFRNYIDDQGAYEAAQIIRCICKDSVDMYEKLSNAVLSKQEDWLHSNDPANFLITIFRNNGLSENDVRACLKRTDIGAGLMLEQKRAMKDLLLISMPSFINDKGKKHVGAITCEELAQFCGL